MSWPSSTKASTTNVDAGSDSPRLARSDIKQNIDNVNSIIDTFDIASPNNGDILVYNSSTSTWDPTAAASGGINLGVVAVVAGEQLVSGTIYRRAVSETFDSNSLLAITGSGYQFTLEAGTYYTEPAPFLTSESTGSEAIIQLYNETDSTEVTTYEWSQVGTTQTYLLSGSTSFTIASTKTFSFRQDTGAAQSRNARPKIKLFKN